ncbi:hypothetical protein HDA36_000699 [Nocardiopsis composta]|uniref:Uncharacterized protein n=2 Tax=Nocardiopsis composta TaxID=157465 RepID=A0A7W8VC58_9ACTN|nr:hypothetical protein [Nocardiopsis composta]
MIQEFRTAVGNVAEVAESRPHELRMVMAEVFRAAPHVSREVRTEGIDALARTLTEHRWSPGVAVEIAILCGALVENDTPAGAAGVEVMRQLSENGKGADMFRVAWEETGQKPPAPDDVTAESERPVAEYLSRPEFELPEPEGVAGAATMAWWVSQRYGLAAKTMLNDAGVRAALRAEPEMLGELTVIARNLSPHIEEYTEVHELLRMAGADRALVLDRASGRGFRVRFDGVADNFQLHVLLADALIGAEGRGVPGPRPHPAWVASSRDADNDPRADVVQGVWDLVGADGTWVGNEAPPADVPVVDGERALVLEPISLPHSWRAGRRHPHIPGWLEVEEELPAEQAAAWWSRIHPAGAVVHPLQAGSAGAGPEAGAAQAAPEPEAAPAAAEGENLVPFDDAVDMIAERMGELLGLPPEAARAPEPAPVPEPAADAPRPAAPESAAGPVGEPAPAADAPPPPPAPVGPEAAAPAPAFEEGAAGPQSTPPGADFLPPLPPGVSDSAGWSPEWKQRASLRLPPRS